MSGRPGRSGGHNRIDPALHILRGTFNATRHAKLLTPQPVWEPSKRLAALEPAGRALVARLTAVYEFAVIEGEVVMEAGVGTDRLADIRARRAQATPEERVALDRLELQWQKQVTGLLLSLRVRP